MGRAGRVPEGLSSGCQGYGWVLELGIEVCGLVKVMNQRHG